MNIDTFIQIVIWLVIMPIFMFTLLYMIEGYIEPDKYAILKGTAYVYVVLLIIIGIDVGLKTFIFTGG